MVGLQDEDGDALRSLTTLINPDWHKGMEVIYFPKNVGVPVVVNTALNLAKTDYFCYLNDDVNFVPHCPDYWSILLDTIKGVPNAGLVGPATNKATGLQVATEEWYPNILSVNFLHGVCMLGPTEVWKEVGGMDLSLPIGDDTDLSIAVKQAGYSLLINRMAYIGHRGHVTVERLYSQEDIHKRIKQSEDLMLAKWGKEIMDTFGGEILEWTEAFSR